MRTNGIRRLVSSFFSSCHRPFCGKAAIALSPRLATIACALLSVSLSMGSAKAADAVPSVSLNAPTSVLLGDSFSFSASFANIAPAQAGFGPFIDIAVPTTGFLGVSPGTNALTAYDGIVVAGAGAVTYLGEPVTYQIITLNNAANGSNGVAHPFALTSAGSPVYLKTGDSWLGGRFKEGDQIVSVRLPFGSFTPSQPACSISINAKLSTNAIVGSNYVFTARGGFQFGNDALNNPATDPSVLGLTSSTGTRPTAALLKMQVGFSGSEGETATGPNFLQTYTLSVQVAPGQTISNLVLTDILPTNMQFVGLSSVRKSGTNYVASTNNIPSTTSPGGTISLNFGDVTGAMATDASLAFQFFEPRLDALNSAIISASSGSSVSVSNQAYASAQWQPVDPRASATVVSVNETNAPFGDAEGVFAAKAIALQKSTAIVSDLGAAGYTPGDIVEYTLRFQVSDYFAFTNLVLTDVLSDGQRFDTNFTPTLSVTEHGLSTSGSMQLANYSVLPNYTVSGAAGHLANPGVDGTTTNIFRISSELLSRSWNGRLLGGGVTNGMTGLHNRTVPRAGATGTLKFRAVIQDRYSDYFPSGEPALNPRDPLSASANISGNLLNVNNLTSIGSSQSDGSGVNYQIAASSMSVSIYAINGNTSYGALNIHPGDTVTYRMTYNLPSGDVENLKFGSFLPLPVFLAQELSGVTFSSTISAAAPPAGQAKFGPNETLFAIKGVVPVVTVDVANGNNTVLFNYGTVVNPANDFRRADILFTVTASTNAFADGLLLANQVQGSEFGTFSTAFISDVMQTLTLSEPVVDIYHGVVGFEGTGLTLGGISFTSPNTAVSSFSGGTIAGLMQASAIDASDITTNAVDAGDKVRFAVVAVNSGRSDAFNVTFTNAIPSGFVVPPSVAAMNLTLRRGNGTLMTQGSDYTATLIGQNLAITLIDSYSSGNTVGDTLAGGLSRGHDAGANAPINNGSSVVVATFDLTLAGSVLASENLTSTATLTRFSNVPSGVNFVVSPQTNTAMINVKQPVLTKALNGTEINAAGNSGTQAVIGELVTYQAILTIPEGVTPAAALVDTMASGLAFVDVVSVSYSSGVSSANAIGTGTNPGNVTIGSSGGGTGNALTFNFGNITNANTGNAANTATILYRAVVVNSLGNQAGSQLAGTATLTYSGGTPVISNPSPVTLIEPSLAVTTTVSTNNVNYAASVNTLQAGNLVYWRMIVTNAPGANNASAYDLYLSNALPAALQSPTIVSVTAQGSGSGAVLTNGVQATGALNNALFSLSGNTFTLANGNSLALQTNSAVTIVLSGLLPYTVNPNQSLTNRTIVRWSSLDGTIANRSVHSASATERTGGVLAPAANVNSSSNDTILENYAASSANAVATTRSTTLANALLGTEVVTSGNSASQATIGEIVSYRLTVTVPQGVAASARITNALPGGLAFLDVTNVSLSPNLTAAQPIGTGNNPANVTVNGSGRFLSFNLGDLTNTDADSAVAETLSISYRAVVLNVLTNQAGTNLVNSATFICSTVGNTNAQGSALTLVEPTLDVQTLVSTNNVNYGTSISTVQAGDPVYFRITVTNASAALGTTAYELTLSNAMPVAVQNPTVVSITKTGAGVVYTNGVAASGTLDSALFAFAGNTLKSGSAIIALETNSALSITVQGQIGYAVSPGQNYQNNVSIWWSGMPGDVASRSSHNLTDSSERTGGTLVPAVGVNASANNAVLNNYAATSGSAVSAIVSPQLSISLGGSSSTVPGNGNAEAVPGEVITYTLTATVPQGVTPGMTISNALPAGLAFVDVTGLSISPGVTTANGIGNGTSPANVTISSSGQNVLFNVGSVTNVDANGATPENVAITYRAVVLDTLSNQAGVGLTNSANLSVTGWGTTNVFGGAVRIVEPTLFINTQLSGDNVSYANSLSGVDAGNTIYIRTTVTNAAPAGGGTTTAYDLSLTNILPTAFLNPTLVSVTKAGNGDVVTNGAVATGALDTGLFAFSGNTLSVATAKEISLQTNSALVVTISATLSQPIQPSQIVGSSPFIRWSSLPGTVANVSIHNAASNERNGGSLIPSAGVNNSTNDTILDNYAATSATANTTVSAPVISSGILATDHPATTGTNVTVGEVVTYRVTVSLPEGTTGNLALTNIVPAGLAYVPGTLQVQSQRPASGIHANHPGTGTAVFAGAGETVVNVLPANPVSGPVTFNFGTITVNADNDANNNTFSFTFDAIVLDVVGNNGLQGTQNNLSSIFTYGAGFAAGVLLGDPSGNVVTVVEPQLSSSQTMAINGNTSLARGDQGDGVILTLVLSHTALSLADAFDISLTNALPVAIGATVNSPLTLGNIVITNNAGADLSGYFTLDSGALRTTNGSTLNLPRNDKITVVITGVLQSDAVPGQSYPNSVTFGYTSRDGDYLVSSGFNPQPSVTTDRERVRSASGSGTALVVNSSSLAGSVFGDANRNNLFDGGESGISGVMITLSGVDNLGNAVLRSTNTAVSGTFTFLGLKPGAYTLTETPPADYLASVGVAGTPFGGSSNSEHSITNIVIAPGSNTAGVNYRFVTPLNQAPSFALSTNLLVVAQDAGPRAVISLLTNISVGAVSESTQSVQFVVSNNSSNLFQAQPTISTNGTLTFQSVLTSNGVAVVTVRAKDDGGTAGGGVDTSAPQNFTIRILSNQAPSFTLSAATLGVFENAGAIVSNNWATISGAGAGELLQSVTNYFVSNNNSGLFSVQPTLALDGTLTFTPAAYSNGVAVVSVFAQDNGGTFGGGANRSATQTFTITVDPVNQPPSFIGGPSIAVNQSPASRSFAGWATSISVGPDNENGQTLQSIVTSNSNPGLFAPGGQPAISSTGTLTFTNANVNGVATIEIQLRDNGGTANGGNDTSASYTFNIQVGTDALVKATGGEEILADDVLAGVWTSLTGPQYSEGGSADVKAGTIVLQAPAGFVFNPGLAPTVLIVSNYADGITASVTNVFPVTAVTSNQVVFTATAETTNGATISLTWQNLQVMPTNALLPSSGSLVGEITYSGTGTLRDIAKNSDSLGTLVEVPGVAQRLTFIDQPVLEQAGVIFGRQPIVKAVDAFSNVTTRVNHLIPASTMVNLTLLGGPGVLSGTRSLSITDDPGVVTGFNLEVNMAGTNWQLVATNDILGATTSAVFTVINPFPTPPPYSTNGLPHQLLSDYEGPIGLWLANLRGNKFPWYTPSIGLLWRDLVVANYNSNFVTVRLCKDNGTFEAPVTYPTGPNPFAVRSGFFSDRVFEDVAVANYGTNTVSMFQSMRDGSGRLLPRVDYVIGSTPNPGPISIASGSFSGSRYSDLFVANSNECTVSVLRNIEGSFVLLTNLPVGLNPMSVHSMDFDGDGIADIVSANKGDGTLSVFHGRTNLTFALSQTIVLFPGGDPQPSSAIANDVNGDGRPDIVVANSASNTVSVLLQGANGNFAIFATYQVGSHPRSVLVRDLNRDEIPDITVANFDGASVDVLLGHGDGTFSPGGRIPVGRNPMCVVGSNFNGDSATDIAVSNYGDDTISMFLYSGPLARDLAVTTIQNVPVSITLRGELLDAASLGYSIYVQPAHGTLSGTPPNLVYTPARNFSGVDTFQYRTHNTNYFGPDRFQFETNGTLSTSFPSHPATVTITVKSANQAPSFAVATNRIVLPSSAALQEITNFSVNITAGEGEESQTLTFLTTISDRSFYSIAPTISAAGTLTFKPSHLAVGTNVIGIRLKDSGNTLNGGENISPTTYVEVVVLPNLAPSFVLATNVVHASSFAPAVTIRGFASAISAGAGETGQTVSFVLSNTNSAFFAQAPVITSDGTLSFAPAWTAKGTTYLTVRSKDNGSTNRGGINLSAPHTFAVVVPAVAHPFTKATSAVYNGLFSESRGVTHETAGFLTVKVTSKLSYSGKMYVDGNAVSFSGKFNVDGNGSSSTRGRIRVDKNELLLNLTLNPTNDTLTGTISDTNWTAALLADRVVWTTNVSEQATSFTNSYTMVMSGFTNSSEGPVGSGYATITVDKLGRVRMAGATADGHAMRQTAVISGDGYWPLYSPAYKFSRLNTLGVKVVETKGMVLGWLQFTNNGLGRKAPIGDLSWIKTGWTNATYSTGFTNLDVQVTGSVWRVPELRAAAPAVAITNALLSFAEGGLDGNAFEASFRMTTNTTLVAHVGLTNQNSVRVSLAPKTGLFKGTFIHPNESLITRYFGVLLQDYNRGAGYFMGATESGTVELQSED